MKVLGFSIRRSGQPKESASMIVSFNSSAQTARSMQCLQECGVHANKSRIIRFAVDRLADEAWRNPALVTQINAYK